MSKPKTLLIDPRDDVAVALRPLEAGEPLDAPCTGVFTAEPIPAGHKIARRDIAAGEDIVKYGAPIGYAVGDIRAGEWVHTHNAASNLTGPLEYQYRPVALSGFPRQHETFMGYLRADGRVGARNELWIIPTVACANQTCEMLARQAMADGTAAGLDGVYAMRHPYGCSQLGDDLANMRDLTAALVNHPNAGGVLVVGLGCETNQISIVQQALGTWNPARVKFYNTQEVGDELAFGARLLAELAEHARRAVRTEVSMEHLTLGLKCGGSDAFSGITANPLIGRMADRVIDCGGTALLTEVPEMFGAETRLMERAADETVYHDIVELINSFKRYYLEHGQPVYDNPSPGNKDGGITTLEDKSLGCTYKGGSRAVTGVLRYAQPADRPGLMLVPAPGNDLVAITALMAAGAQIILFSTGRGNPMGTFVPTIKIGTNSAMSLRKAHWIDFDAGRIIDGMTQDEAADALWAIIGEVASGRRLAANERNGQREMTLFKTGVTV
ncbi:MAG: UxaA family hydrolase [Christensenellales bacterium]